jgi:hypothetical protein
MTEQVPLEGPETESSPPHTGVAEVDAALDDLESLDGLPLDEHPAAFARAHDRLRGALDAPDPEADPPEPPEPPDHPA